MMEYHVVVGSQGGTGEETFAYRFDGEPQINLTFEHAGAVYRVVTRAHDEHAAMPTVHAERM